MPSVLATCVSTCTVAGVSGWSSVYSHTITIPITIYIIIHINITTTPYLVLLFFFFNSKHTNHSARLVSAIYDHNAIATQFIAVLVEEGILIYLISNLYL